MRSDMFELLLERPRRYRGCRGRKAPPYPRASLRERHIEDAALKEPMGGVYREKSLSENFAPLIRWLGRQVGRPWSNVYAEISEHLSPTCAVKQHVRDHVDDFVEVSVIEEDGVLYGTSPRRGFHPIGTYRSSRPTLYVCPRTGILREHRGPARPSKDVRPLGDGRYLVRRNGVFSVVVTVPAPPYTASREGWVCAYSKLPIKSRAYASAQNSGQLGWSWERVAISVFVPGKRLRQELLREAERLAIAARQRP